MSHIANSKIYYFHPSLFAKENLFYVELAGEYLEISNYKIERDFYDSLLIMYIEKGKLTVEVESGNCIVEKGEFVFVDCRYPHKYYSKDSIALKWIHIQGNVVFAYSQLLKRQFGDPIVIKESSIFLHEFELIMSYLRGGNPIEHSLSVQIHRLFATISERTTIQMVSTDHALVRAETYLRQNFDQQFSISDVSRNVGMSIYYFTHQFRKRYGVSPYEYLITQRISNAKRLLLNTNMSTKQIAAECGYSNPSTFIAAFKTRVGCPPKQFKKNVVDRIGL